MEISSSDNDAAWLWLKLGMAAALAWLLVLADYRLGNLTSKIRTEISSLVITPARLVAQLPAAAWTTTSDYLRSREDLIADKQKLEEQLLRDRNRLNLLHQIERENESLRRLVAARNRINKEAVIAEIVNTASLPFINRIVINKGSDQGVALGQGVYNDQGVIGQLSRVDSDTSQALLLTDKRFWVASRLRKDNTLVLLQGDGGGKMRLRFVPADVQLRKGDFLDTASGAGPFPGGVPVAIIESIWQLDGVPFLEGIAYPIASVRQESVVLINEGFYEDIPDTKIPVENSGAVPAGFNPEVLP